MSNYDDTKESNYLINLDANNLYGWSMVQSLPYDKIKIDNNLAELSMGMSSDYKEALDCGSTYLRIGSAIFK